MDAVILENRGTYILKLIINYGVVFHLDNYRSRSKPKNSRISSLANRKIYAQ